MNILGESFYPEITNQINIRQKIYGLGFDQNSSRSNESIQYLNGNTAWCKLVSSTRIANPNILNNTSIKQLGLTGNELAEKFILFNGVQDKNGIQRSGISSFSSPSGFNNAYGIGGTEFGLNPMMGIISTRIQHKNRGSIRMANIKIKAWNKFQFDIIDVLYLRLGFSVLLEWGNSNYFNNNGKLQTNVNNSLSNDFLKGSISYEDFLNKITSQRKKSLGNYDAMFGKVSNFHWSFQPDGSYDIDLDLVSVGDIIESFKINRTDSINISITNQQTENDLVSSIDSEESNLNAILLKYASTSNIANFLYKLGNLLNSPQNINTLYNISYNTNFNNYFNSEYDKSKNSPDSKKDALFVIPDPNELKIISESENGERKILGSVQKNVDNKFYYFIRLGCFLKYIEEGVLYKVKNNNKNTPILKFDYSVEDNLMHAPPQLMSYDPFVCMVNRTVEFPGLFKPIIPSRTYFEAGDKFEVENQLELGKVMNIYLNFKFILQKLEELKSVEDGSVQLIDFLKSILDGINGAFGGFSRLDVFIDETTNSVKIIDQNPLPSSKTALEYVKTKGIETSTDYAKFELYGYSLESGDPKSGFIKNFKFQTELTPEFSTMISVAATSNGNVVGENNTALSKLNLGLQDRFKEEINDNSSINSVPSPDLKSELYEKYNTSANNFINFSYRLKKFLDNIYQDIYIKQEVEENKQAVSTFFKLFKEYKKNSTNYFNGTIEPKNDDSSQPGTGFIPFNLSLTMDGLSGMKIGSKFLINTSYLPSNYPKTVDFLIKNIQHEISNNKWFTTIESYCISQGSETNPISKIPDNPQLQPDIVQESNLEYKSTPDDELYRYLSWQQGPTGLSQHYKLITGKSNSYSYPVTANFIKQNWPGNKVSSKGIKKQDIDALFISNPKLLAEAFLDVWKQNFYLKGIEALSLINSNGSNRTGLLYSQIKNAFVNYSQPNNGITWQLLSKIGYLENILNTDTEESGTYQTMFQMSKTYLLSEINKLNKTKITRNNKTYINYSTIEKLTQIVTPELIKNFNQFKSISKYPN